MRTRAGIAIGSNLASALGGREDSLRIAVEQLSNLGTVAAVSSWYDTAPVGYVDQPRFLNGAVLLETHLEASALLHGLLAIEMAMGRVRGGVPAKGPRVIDLDILFFGDAVIQTSELVVPHPEMAGRRFVLEPLAEIAAGWTHPVSGMTVAEMLGELTE